MASLVENTQRIVNGLNDAYDIVQNRAGSCSRKAENLASEIDSIPSGGGSKVATGTFTSSTNVLTIDCGFKPSKVMVFSGNEGALFPMAAYYNIEGSQRYVGARATSIGAGSLTVSLLELTNNGFTHHAPNQYYANLTSYYIAVE